MAWKLNSSLAENSISIKQAFQGRCTDETHGYKHHFFSNPNFITHNNIHLYSDCEETLSATCINLLGNIIHAMYSRLKSYRAIKDKSMT